MMNVMKLCATLFFGTLACAATVSPLFQRGYAVIPEPQHVRLQSEDFQLDSSWSVQGAAGAAMDELRSGIQHELGISLSESGNSGHLIEFAISSGAVKPEGVSQEDYSAIADQAYRIQLSPERIRIQANSETGAFYAACTLVQLLSAKRLPVGEIVDWPNLPLRHIYWDDSHHLERMDALKAAIHDAAALKINGFVLKLDGHFQYASAPAAVEPVALSPNQLQELTDYGLKYHVQVIPYLDAPGHIYFLLKHPEYAKLRAFPDSNYELCTTNPESVALLHRMYGDLLAANRGGKYFYLSTDEAYYVGQADNAQCQERGNPSALWVDFLKKAASYLHDHGREVIFWGETPLKPAEIPSIPSYLIDGEIYGERYDPVFHQHGIRQMIYEPVEGEERLFPHYFLLPQSRRLHPMEEDFEKIGGALSDVDATLRRGQADVIGTITAGWGDMGLHPETFWLGYGTVAAAGWKQWSGGDSEAIAAFCATWFGLTARGMAHVYQMLSLQAEVWQDTWDSTESNLRPGIWGDSNGKFPARNPAHDQTIPLPPVPDDDLHYASTWPAANQPRLSQTDAAWNENATLRALIQDNLLHADSHRYDLEVFLSVADLSRQNLSFIQGLKQIDDDLTAASKAARDGHAQDSVDNVDRALAQAEELKRDRDRVYNDTVETWQKTWEPRVSEAFGRTYLNEYDDVKDHLPARTVDMSYLMYRELNLPLDDWYARTEESRNKYAQAHGIPPRHSTLRWPSLK